MAEPRISLVATAGARNWLARRLRDQLLTLAEKPAPPRLAIAGGSVLEVMDKVLDWTPPAVWGRVALTWVDERVVPHDSPDSNYGASRTKAGADDAGTVLPLVRDGDDAPGACARFLEQFEQQFHGGLDLAVLGMGEDGHVASLFPGHRLLEQRGLAGWVVDSPKPPPQRVTLLFDALNQPQTTRFVYAVGAGKRAALERLMRRDPAIPATRLADFTLVTDQTSLTETT